MRSVLITGGAGFLGSHLVETLQRRACRVTVIDRNFPAGLGEAEIDLDALQLVEGNLAEILAGDDLDITAFDTVFHLAGTSSVERSVSEPIVDLHDTTQITLVLLERLRTAANPPKLIYVSSAAVYGEPACLPIGEDDPTIPLSPYGVSKLAAERYVTVYSRIHGLKCASVRPFSIYGPRQRKQVVYDLLCKLVADPTSLAVLGTGHEARDFIYVSDVVDAMLTVEEQGALVGEAYNVASGDSTPIRELVRVLCEATNSSPQVNYSNVVRPGDPERWSVDVSRLVNLGFRPKVTLLEGIQKTHEWLLQSRLEHRTTSSVGC